MKDYKNIEYNKISITGKLVVKNYANIQEFG
jgi:hypothetical protein